MTGGRKAYILGAGMTGLAAGKGLSEKGFKVVIFEKNEFLGGMCATFRQDGFLLDLGPHKFFSVMDDVLGEVKKLLEDELLEVHKRSRIRLMDRYFDYPVNIKALLSGMKPEIVARMILDYTAVAAAGLVTDLPEESYKNWIVKRFGKTIFRVVFGPYAEKIWGDPEKLDAELARTRIAVPNLFKMFTAMVLGIKDKEAPMHASTFYYARKGSAVLAEKMAGRIRDNGGEIRLAEEISEINLLGDRVASISPERGPAIGIENGDFVISTMPLQKLKSRIGIGTIPNPVRAAVDRLRTRDLILQYIVVNKPKLSDDNWIFFPERGFIFNRVFEQKSFSPFMVPKDKTVLCAEITCDSESPLWGESEDVIFEKVSDQLAEIGLLRKSDILGHFDRRLRHVYPVYDLSYRGNRRIVFDYLDSIRNFFSIGRSGGFNYVGMLDCFDMGIKTADFIAEGRCDRTSLRKSFDGYVVLD